MNHDEKTTEIEIPTKRVGNVVRVDFAAMEAKNRAANAARATTTTSATPAGQVARMTPKPRAKAAWWTRVEISTPWMLRLLAVITVLILSLLIF